MDRMDRPVISAVQRDLEKLAAHLGWIICCADNGNAGGAKETVEHGMILLAGLAFLLSGGPHHGKARGKSITYAVMQAHLRCTPKRGRNGCAPP
jgi:hypothetical protein